jgi:hypothetical protein
MGQFKPMVKMETTEPSVELKLKKGGKVAHKSMKDKSEGGFKPMSKMADGGVLAALAGTPALLGRPAINAPIRAPGKPSMAARRMAMAKLQAGANRAPMAPPSGLPVTPPALMSKKGGEVESKADAKKEVAFMEKNKAPKKMIKDEKTEEGLKCGGKAKYATGGVVNGQGGYKTGGVVKGQAGYATGGVAKGNGGGYKSGGKAKKFAEGGKIDTGRPQQMPQGKKSPSKPVRINELAGTFKKGGNVKKYASGGTNTLTGGPTNTVLRSPVVGPENPIPVNPSPRSPFGRWANNTIGPQKYISKPYSGPSQGLPQNGGPSHYQPNSDIDMDPQTANPLATMKKGGKAKKFAEGGDMQSDRETQGYNKWKANQKAENEADVKGFDDMLSYIPRKLHDAFKSMTGQGAVTDTKTTVSRTVSPPAKKRGGKIGK